MRRLLPSPALSVALLLLWILLMQSLSAGTLVLGTALAVFWPAVTLGLRPTPVRLRRPSSWSACSAGWCSRCSGRTPRWRG
ncbi:hypothetical protein ACN28S_65020 [Cystobacter fuscus]